MRYHVPDMACGGCVQTITEALTTLDPAIQVKADLAGKTVTVETTRPPAEVERSLLEAGYPASPA